MNWINQNSQRLLSIVLIIGLLFSLLQNSGLRKKLDATKIQNIHSDSEAKQVKIEYLEKAILVSTKSSDSLTAVVAQQKEETIKLRKEIDRLKIAKHEKYTAINRMSGHELYDFFAKLNTGSSPEGK